MDQLSIDGTKIQLHPERVAQWMQAKTTYEKMSVYPLYVEVSPVGHCNHRCTFCAVDYIGYKPRSIQTAKMTELLGQMGKCGVKSVMFAGEGEPLLHKDMAHITNYAKDSGLDVSFTTNGVLMTEEFVEECLHSVSWIKVSLNAGDAKTYKAVHKARDGDFEKVLANISYASMYKDMAELKTKIGVQMVVLPENVHTVDALCLEASASGADYVVLKPYSQHKSSVNEMKVDYREVDRVLMRAQEEHTNEYFKVIYRRESALAKGHKYSQCYSTPNFWAYVMATGDVYGCSAYLLDDRFCYGNINEKSFQEIWLGEKRRASMEYVERELDIGNCRLNCRMDKANQYLWRLKNPEEHDAFI